MTHEEIIEGNRLIAEFLGSKFINDAPEDYPNGYYYQPKEIEGDCPTGIPEDWGFESSWDWLMPVIKHIREIINTEFSFDEFATWREELKQIDPYEYSIEQCHESVIEFIKWWNASLADR